MNIIIVDDDAFVSASLKIILESYSDITVLATGANGHDAISSPCTILTSPMFC